MAAKFTAIDSKGQKFEVDDSLANRRAVVEQGYKVDDSIVRSLGEAAQGVSDAIGAHWITKYNPLMLVPRGIAEGVGSLAGARSTEDLQKEAAALDKGKFVAVDSRGSVFHIDDTEANRKAVLEQGYKIPTGAELKAISDPAFQGARGAGRAYLESVGNEYLMGIPEIVDKETAQDLAALRKAHPIASGAGSVAGFAAGLATPGLSGGKAAATGGRLAERGLAKLGVESTSLAGKVIKGAAAEGARGAAIAAPRAGATAIWGDDPRLAGEIMLTGAGVGVLLGGLAPAIRNGIATRTSEAVSGKIEGLIEKDVARLQKEAGKAEQRSIGLQAQDAVADAVVDKAVKGTAAAIGGAIGGFPGAAVGYGLAGAAKLATSPAARVKFMRGVAAAYKGVEKIGDAVGRGAVASMPATERLLVREAGEATAPKARSPRTMSLEAARSAVIKAATDPEQRSVRIGAISQAAPDEAVASAAGLAASSAVDFLFDKLPKKDGQVSPYANMKDTASKMSEIDFSRWGRYLDGTVDPLGTIQRNLAAGTLTKEHVEAVQHSYPALMDNVRMSVAARISDPKSAKLTKAQRDQVDLLMGGGLEQRTQPARVAAYQGVYKIGSPPTSDEATDPQPAKRTQRVPINIKGMPTTMTTSQALAGRAARAGK